MGEAAGQAVRVPSVAQAVDEGSQLAHVVHFSSHHHLFVDDVGLRQVRSLLQETQVTTTTTTTTLDHTGCPHNNGTAGGRGFLFFFSPTGAEKVIQ